MSKLVVPVDPVLQNTAKLVFWSIFSHPGCHFGCPFDPLGSDLAHFGTNYGESGGEGSSSEGVSESRNHNLRDWKYINLIWKWISLLWKSTKLKTKLISRAPNLS